MKTWRLSEDDMTQRLNGVRRAQDQGLTLITAVPHSQK